MKWVIRIMIFLLLLMVGPLYMALFGNISLGDDWRTADRSSVGLAPDPQTNPEAIVQVYSARAFNWRGIFAVHTWIATKTKDADSFIIHQVLGWRLRNNDPVVVSHYGIPDRSWYGNRPEILAELRGDAADAVIPAVEQAVHDYPYATDYTLWPGPNSNTFTAWVGRNVPELTLDLPTTAIGKDFLANGALFSRAPSGTGYQLSLYGVLGVTAALREGLEFNLFTLNFGVDPLGLALKLPGLGRLGFTPH